MHLILINLSLKQLILAYQQTNISMKELIFLLGTRLAILLIIIYK